MANVSLIFLFTLYVVSVNSEGFLEGLTTLLFTPIARMLRQISGLDDPSVVGPEERNLADCVQFYLFTLKNRNIPEEITDKGASLKNSTFWNTRAKVKIIIHGYFQRAFEPDNFRKYSSSSDYIKNGYMEMNRPENVVIIDWDDLADDPNYFSSVKDSRSVAAAIIEFIIFIVENKLTRSYNDIHIIGFSIGAHVAGLVGYLLQMIRGSKIGRITALDPAGPGFESEVDKKYRIDLSDAKFVDAIHCNGGDILKLFKLGTTISCGHADFYPNGGILQPECMWDVFGLLACSHLRCPKLFVKSIKRHEFVGCSCKSLSMYKMGFCDCHRGPLMGEFCPENVTGDYYLTTEFSL